jgi:hypothetical protein
MDTIFSQSFLHVGFGDFSNDIGKGNLPAIYRSADRYLGAFQSLTVLTEILHCVQDDEWKAEQCVGMKAKVFELH